MKYRYENECVSKLIWFVLRGSESFMRPYFKITLGQT